MAVDIGRYCGVDWLDYSHNRRHTFLHGVGHIDVGTLLIYEYELFVHEKRRKKSNKTTTTQVSDQDQVKYLHEGSESERGLKR